MTDYFSHMLLFSMTSVLVLPISEALWMRYLVFYSKGLLEL